MSHEDQQQNGNPADQRPQRPRRLSQIPRHLDPENQREEVPRPPRRPLTPPQRRPQPTLTAGQNTAAHPQRNGTEPQRTRPTSTGGAAAKPASTGLRRPATAGQTRRSAAKPNPAFLQRPTDTDAPLTTGMRSRRIEIERRKARERRQRGKIRSVIILSCVSVILLICGYLAVNALFGSRNDDSVIADYQGSGTGEIVAVVNPGDTGAVIAKNLVKLDVVKSEAAFIKAWDANQAAASVQPGSYTLKLKMSGVDAVAALLDPTKRTSNAISIPPGFTIWQVEERLKAFEKFTPEQVDAALADPQALGLPAEAQGNLEGWLLPGSYEVHSDDTPADVLRSMITATVKELDELGIPQGQRQTLLIKASILEREVNIDQYLPQVARVIENRLSKPDAETVGLLQMDSTVLYGLKRAGGVPTGAEVKQDTPYNTYIHKGLPPGPISMPSRAAVEATLKPANGTWLYFVTVNLKTGETKFSSTSEEHQKYVDELTAWCAANKGSC